MIYIFIKMFFIYALGLYIYFALSNYHHTTSLCFARPIFALLLALIATTISINYLTLYFLLTLPFYVLTLYLISYRKINFSISYMIISISIAQTIYSIMTLPVSFILFMINIEPIMSYISFVTFINGALSSFIVILALKNKRIIKALHLMCDTNNFYIYVSLAVLLMLTIIIGQAQIQSAGNSKMYVIIIIMIGFILLYVIQRQTQKYYLSKLKKLELESLRQELAEKDALIQKLQESNDHLARIIHKDNKLIPSMVSAVSRYLRNVNTLDADALRASGMTLARELEQMAQNRQGILSENEHQTDGIPHSGHAAVDAILLHMQNRAAALHIDYTVTLGAEFSDTVNRMITESDLTHLLADLIENALNATKESGTRCVLVHLGILYDAPVVEISDSGISFDPAVYQDFGLQKHSTHLTDGGSGIGLMDIWELKKKYAASLHIHEYEPGAASYTKKISVVFDRRNHYLIRTYRPQELLQYRIRTDMFILPLE